MNFNHLAFYSVPRAGVEPARVAPLVFETSASTDSAIWALFYSGVPEQMRCKGSAFFDNRQIFRAVFCSMKLRERNGMRRTWGKGTDGYCNSLQECRGKTVATACSASSSEKIC